MLVDGFSQSFLEGRGKNEFIVNFMHSLDKHLDSLSQTWVLSTNQFFSHKHDNHKIE